jgi:hypothetical protein
MNFFQYSSPKAGEFWVEAETQEAADALVKSGNFTAINLSSVLESFKAQPNHGDLPGLKPQTDLMGFLHRHPHIEALLHGHEKGHVVVDERDWEIARQQFYCADTRCFQRKC